MNDPRLVDTNILVYAHDISSPQHDKAKSFLENPILHTNFVISLQNITEFYSVVTNPKKYPSPLSSKKARGVINQLITSRYFKIIFPLKETVITLLNLLLIYDAKGAEVFDVLLASVMLDNGVKTIYTADTRIFKRLGLKAINPLASGLK